MPLLQSTATRLLQRGQLKPSGVPRINWSHRLAQGLLFYGFDTGNGLIVDLARGLTQNQVPSTTVAGNTTTQWGTGINWNASDARYFNSDAAIRNATANNNHSWACAYVQTGTVGSWTRPFGRTALQGASPPYLNWDFEINPSIDPGQNVVIADAADGVGGNKTSGSWAGNANNTFTSLLATFTSSTNYDFYTQGVYRNSNTVSARTSNDTNDAILFSGSSSAASGNSFAGVVFYGAFWNRTLGASEALQLHLDPYCFLEFPTRGLPALFGAAPLSLTGSQTIPAFSQTATLAALVQINTSQTIPAFVTSETLAALVQAAASQSVPDFTVAQTLSHDTALSAIADQTIPGFGSTETLAALIQAAAAQVIPGFGQSATDTVTVTLVAAQDIPAFTQAAVLGNRQSRTFAFIII